MDVAAKLHERLRHHLRTLPEDQTLGPDAALDQFGFDSMTAVDLLQDLEQTFGITFPDELIEAETFRTPANLERAINSLLRS